MEAGRNFLSSASSFPLGTHLRNCLSSSSSSSSTSVLMLHEQAAPAVTSMLSSSTARRCYTSVLLQEQRDETGPPSHVFKKDVTSWAISERRQMETEASVHEDKSPGNSYQLVQDFERQLLHWPGLWHLFPSLQTGKDTSSSLTMQPVTTDMEKPMDVEACNVVALAKKALSASKEAALLAEDSELIGTDFDDPLGLVNLPLEEGKRVRSTRLLERRSKKRRVPKPIAPVYEINSSRNVDVKRKISEGFDPNDPLRLFLWGPETKQLLTAQEESELIAQVQDLMKLEEVKSRLQSHFSREPTLHEWAEGVGLSYRVLRLQVYSGNSSRKKLIYANLRMVVHIAKQYLGRGLSLQDLLQEGSMGLMKSVEKFKPQAGCRFGTYAYWWIRQTIRKAIFQHSRTIRLPENVHTLLGKVMESKRQLIQGGNHCPTKEELARHVGITVDKLQKLLYSTRMPLSMQQPVWADQDTTFQEITADTGTETPDVSVSKQLMRQHVRHLLSILSPRERRIIRLRFGIEDGNQKSLLEIGNMFGLSKERVRQLENRALYRLKQQLGREGLGAYSDLLV
ncbi:RNA polymerase sigma factor sigF, chloroplastic isoform X2 [Corylus avellana]|uniref:RNA polymerase sigma factor sigF, chloroplastic isoform X2 n=1 Tax=Corylus avellana TaxID=13451 RepID=UPI00286C31E5|nr:RNA polymerase sigma factor sigF, chloroplastic isoform X2 [Corylus avellana]